MSILCFKNTKELQGTIIVRGNFFGVEHYKSSMGSASTLEEYAFCQELK